jgi:sigma-B regulation protein RsbU (phosphoserine phosphatase)
MQKNILNKFRNSVKTHRDSLLGLLNLNSATKKIILANSGVGDVVNLIQEHNEVLERIDKGEFGKCIKCNGEVEIDRLEYDFTTTVCLDHYSETQLQVLERDLELAAKVQKQLLPQVLPILTNIQVAVHTEPAHIVSGDYFDFFEYPDKSQGMAVADVMGKGLPASMLMSKLQAWLHILGPEHNELQSLASRLNELLRYNLTLIRFISLFLIKLDSTSKTLHYCNAGHNPAIWWNSSTKTVQLLRPTGPAIGLSHTSEFSSKRIQLDSGDLILIYTDGIVEARDEHSEEFGQKRIENFIKENNFKSAKDFLNDFKETFKKFTKHIQDDITLLILKVS